MTRGRYFRISREVVEKLAACYGSPLLVLSLDEIKKNYKILRKYMPRVRIHYAVKANPHPDILQTLDKLGSCFDVASDGEIRLLHDLCVDGSRMVYANPVKTASGFEACRECGVSRMTFDSFTEIEKIKHANPHATVLLRIRIDNPSALVDLNKKFGARVDQALPLMLAAKEAGLDMAGIAFHVGSQTVRSDPYLQALEITRVLFGQAKEAGLNLRVLDIGGGFPIPETKTKFNLPAILQQINARLEEDFPHTEIWAEPGRFICGTAVNLITSVIGVTERGQQPWYYLDEGLYGTFSGILFDHWDFQLISFRLGGKKVPSTFAGPSCDSLDIMFHGMKMVPLEVGDLLLVPACGAYTSASSTTFNGFSKARFVIWEKVKNQVERQVERAAFLEAEPVVAAASM